MKHLHQIWAEESNRWRDEGYPCDDFPTIGEILDYPTNRETGSLRYLRKPELHALEVYW